MSASAAPTWRRVASILWFPVFFTIALPLAFEVNYHQPTPHREQVAVVGSAIQVRLMTDEFRGIDERGFVVHRLPSAAAATAAVRDRNLAAAYVATGTSPPTVYLARAASFLRANYLQAEFLRVAAQTGKKPPRIVDLVPLASGDSGTGLFFFVFPLMMAGLIAALALQQLPTWGIGRRVVVVAGVGAVAALAAYLTAVGLHVLPGKPLLLVYGFLLVEVYGQLMVGAAPLLKQYFLPFALTLSLILSVPSSGGTVTPDLLPGLYRFLSHVLPLAQGVTITRGVTYFHGTGIAQATVVLLLWAAIAAAAVVIAGLRQSRAHAPDAQPRRRHKRTRMALSHSGQRNESLATSSVQEALDS